MKKFVLIGTLVLLGAYLNVVALPEESHACSFTAFGPKDYVRTSGKPTTATENFSILDPNTHYTLHLYNGGKDDQHHGKPSRWRRLVHWWRDFDRDKHSEEKVSSAVVWLNGRIIIAPSQFNQKVSHIQKSVRLLKNNKLTVEIRGKPEGRITIEITGIDKTLPTISATISPSPNAAGWNNTNVMVSFTCSDKTSGIAFCPGPVLVQEEGVDQVITGTATDNAGNTASTSVTINIDKTPPVVAIVSPSPGATIEDSPVTVQGTINEALSGVATITCNGTPATFSNSSFTCNVSLAIGENFLQTAATDVAGNTGQASITVAYLGPKYLAIVDVMVTDRGNFDNVPDDYTGLAWNGTTTNPFIPGVIGERVLGNDVNVGIGGTTTTVWVKYDFVPVASNRRVLVDYGVFHWPYWNAYCPEGWERCNGTSDGRQCALTTETDSDCWRIGLCVHYVPMNQTDAFITNVSLSSTGGSEAACPVLGEANLGYWPMQADSLDIHRGCGDNRWMYLCYGRGKAWPPMPTSIDVRDEEKFNFLATYAPRVWIASKESYWPSSVEWAFPHLVRFIPCTEYQNPWICGAGPEYASYYWLRTREDVEGSDVLDFFRGCNGYSTSNPCTINDVPVYAFWVKKSVPVGGELFDYVDLVYFFYYPYNRGKEVANTIWESHVGDWEHVTVRLMWVYDDQTGWSVQPVQVYLSAHDFGGIYEWEDMAKINDTHPVIFSAWGSHGVWLTADRHKYGEACPADLWCEDLVDWTSEGTAWDTWNNMETFDYNFKQGIGGSIWPLWMSDDFTNPGTCGDPSNPACGPIYRWGNMQGGCHFGYCRMTTGPTGPVSKGVWSPGILK